MLRHTFQHLPGIGAKSEQTLWDRGLLSWDDLDCPETPGIPARKLAALRQNMAEPRSRLEQNDCRYFAGHLAPALHWRLFPEFRDRAVYLDIETTGLEWSQEIITTIAMYDGRTVQTFVQGQNLDDFPEAVRRYDMIVTYNGKCFDVPFIEGYFNITMDHAHLDLRYLLKSLGYGGGLKGCERALGIDRGALQGVDGFFAVLLWHDYLKTADPRTLETLLAYNVEDVVNLEMLMVMAYNMNIRKTPFAATHELPLPQPPAIPFRPDSAIIARLMRAYR